VTQIVYSTEHVANLEGREFRNPRHFLTPVEGATKVYIAGSWPKVREAYEAAGVPVAPVGEMRALPKASSTAKPRKKANAKPASAPDPDPTPPADPEPQA